MQLRTRSLLCLAFLLAPLARTALAHGEVGASNMAAALETVRADNIRADLYFIASDDLGGRGTPSEGQRIAARFIRSRLERLGWKPGAKDGYLYPYELDQKRIDEAACKLTYEEGGRTTTLKLGTDYWLSSSIETAIADIDTTARVVFLGQGTKEDFEKAGIEGRWVLCFDDGAEIGDVARRARKAKCAGLVMAPGPDYKGQAYEQRFAGAFTRQKEGNVSPRKKVEADKKPEKPKEDGRDKAFPTILLSHDASRGLLAAARVGEKPPFGKELSVTLHETRAPAGNGIVVVEDVCGFWPGNDPDLSKEVILVTAHYDHLGTENGVVFNGADDNGSGTCGLMAIAEALATNGPLRRSVMLIWVSGEEKGLWGSKAWVDNPTLPEGTHAVADINIDMIGRNAPDKLLITPTAKMKKEYNGLVRLAESLSPLEGFPELGSADKYYTRSDHYNFAKLGIPITFLFSDVHEDYHQATDKPDKIDYDKIRRVVRLVLRMLDGMQADKLDVK